MRWRLKDRWWRIFTATACRHCINATSSVNYLVPEVVNIYEYCRWPLHAKVAVKDDA